MIDPKKLRIALGMTLQQVGDDLKVSHSTVSGWESKRRTPAISQALKLSKVLGVPDQKVSAFMAFWGNSND